MAIAQDRTATQCSHQTTKLGAVAIAFGATGVCSIEFDPDPAALDSALVVPAWISLVVAWLDDPKGPFPVAVNLVGTPFQREVWQAIQKIPAGSTTTYAELARQVGRPRAVRAVGSAVGSNSLALVVPCHRVIRTDGGLGGFRWGLDRKRTLLNREGGWSESVPSGGRLG